MTNTNKKRDVYVAVADPTRRELIRLLAVVEELPLHELTSQFEMGRTAVSKHLAILKDAHLVTVRKVGRETRYRLNTIPLEEIQDWVAFYSKFWSTNILRLSQQLEGEEQ
ncbi:ArsR/SmtB family transcription factor [Psychrobacillus sp. L4]|uniref:ArsR/SmtB family transcription factor n=1 Tax=Psychrobacillus sp. L4 TaxID=3236892 RepID=UPI0036F3D51E